MAAARVITTGAICLFVVIGLIGLVKKKNRVNEASSKTTEVAEKNSVSDSMQEILTREIVDEKPKESVTVKEEPKTLETSSLPSDVDRIHRLFTFGKSRLPIVQTIAYTSRVSWLNGRPAWIADYASYFGTSRHFIARGLNGKPDYFTQKVSSGDRFNVFSKEKDVEFYSVVDLSQLKMWFYAYNKSDDQRILLKTYKVGAGKSDTDSESGSLTPVGRFLLGDKVAIYKPGVEGFFEDQKVEMIQIFGTRWIPFKEEIDDSKPFAKGLGIHGAPWHLDQTTSELVEDKGYIGQYDSSGCLRLGQQDMEEFFSIVITKPTVIDIVKHFEDAKLPGTEWIDPLESKGE